MNRTILRVTWRPSDEAWAVVRGQTVGFEDSSRELAEAFALEHARELCKGVIQIESRTGSVEREIHF